MGSSDSVIFRGARRRSKDLHISQVQYDCIDLLIFSSSHTFNAENYFKRIQKYSALTGEKVYRINTGLINPFNLWNEY